MQDSFGNSIRSLFGQQLALSVAHPADGCAALDNQADVAGTVVLVLRGTCFFAVKVLAPFADPLRLPKSPHMALFDFSRLCCLIEAD